MDTVGDEIGTVQVELVLYLNGEFPVYVVKLRPHFTRMVPQVLVMDASCQNIVFDRG